MRHTLLAAVLVLTACVWQTSAAFGADSIYWGNFGNNTISHANLDGSGGGGQLSTTGATPNGPGGVAIDAAAGKIYWANGSSNANPISYANLDGSGGGNLPTAGATANAPQGVAIDPAAGRIYWANEFGNTISYANLNGSGGGQLPITGATPNDPIGVAIDPDAGRIYWSNNGSNTIPISYANLDGSGGGNLPTAGATANVPYGVALDPAAGRIYWANYNGNTISYANLDGSGGGNLPTAGATPNAPAGLAVDHAGGRIYWANNSSNANPISYANLDGSGGGNLTTTGATANSGSFPALLEAPMGSTAPQITGSSSVGSKLSCSHGSWAPDLLGSFLYRAPGSFAYQWSFNGADIGGATSSSYTAAAAGSYTCRVTAANDAGSASQTSAPVTVVGTALAPHLTNVGQSHRRWRRGSGLPHIASGKRPPVGTTFRFTLNESAKVRFVFRQHGHKRGTLSFTVGAGAHKLRFQGRISRKKRLRPGHYKLTITATNPSGLSSAATTLRFTILAG